MARITHGEEWMESSLRSRYLREYASAHRKEIITVERREELLTGHGPFLSTLGRTVANLLDYVWDGIYHLDAQQLFRAKWADEKYIVLLIGGGLQTWDFNQLTKLVVAAHDLAVRVEVNPSTFRYLSLHFSQRTRAPGVNRNCEYHPTIEEAVRVVRSRAQFTDLEFCAASEYDDRCRDLAVFEHRCGRHWLDQFGHEGRVDRPSRCRFCGQKGGEPEEPAEGTLARALAPFPGYFLVGDFCPKKAEVIKQRLPVATLREAEALWPISRRGSKK